MKNMLKEMLKNLSDEDKVVFAAIAENLNKIDGDVTQLSADDLAIISTMESKYAGLFSSFSGNENLTEETLSKSEQPIMTADLLETGFADFARKLLSRDLKEQFPKEDDAIKFAFQNKWLPQDFKDEEAANKIFLEYERDISDANQWREEVVGIDADKKMAVGMTWFMVIYQLHHR